MVCKKCGKQFEGVFCPYCGERNATELPPECPVCSTPRKDQEKFCSNCGYSYYGVNLARLKREEMAKNAKTNAQNAVTFVKKHRTPFIAAAVLLVLVLIVVIPTTVWATNIFRTGKVDQISIGMSQKEVIDKLGMPYDYSPNSSGFSYYSDNYLKLKEKLDSLDLEDIESFEELEDAIINEEKYREELENTVYDYIYIGFDGDGLVDSVFFDNEKCDKDTDVKKRVKDSELITESVVRYQETPVYYRVEYKDGSLYKGLAKNVTAMSDSYTLEWTDRYGNDFQDRVETTPNSEIAAMGECGEDAIYVVDTEGIMTISGSGTVTSSDYYDDNLKKITIEKGITEIDNWAFSGFDMTEVEIPSGVTHIGDRAFYGCEKLTDVTIPSTVTELGDDIFGHCISLKVIGFQGTRQQWSEFEANSSGNDRWGVECSDGRYRYAITYVLNGGINAEANPTSHTLNVDFFNLKLADPIKLYEYKGAGIAEVAPAGYTFLGWYRDAAFEQKFVLNTRDFDTDLTLYAKWGEPVSQTSTVQVYTREGDYIYFGEYPQTIKASDVTVGDVADEDGYYLGSDGERYAKVVADPYESGYTFSDGSEVTDGETYYFKVEPIRWRILSEDDGCAFILADSIIENTSVSNTWLNEEFFNKAFDEVSQSFIKSTVVDNSIYSFNGRKYGTALENTYDKVFLLSVREVCYSEYGFASDPSALDTARYMIASDYVQSNGILVSESRSDWWLRSRDGSMTWCIGYDGSSGISSFPIKCYGVVPAMNIKL